MFKEVILRKNMFKIILKVGVHHSNACRLGNWVTVSYFTLLYLLMAWLVRCCIYV